MSALNKSIREVLEENHPKLHLDQLHEGENILHQGENGIKYVAVLTNGKISQLTAFGPDGAEGTVVRIQPPPTAHPDHTLVCICTDEPISTGRGEGVRCWWEPNPGEGGGRHPA